MVVFVNSGLNPKIKNSILITVNTTDLLHVEFSSLPSKIIAATILSDNIITVANIDMFYHIEKVTQIYHFRYMFKSKGPNNEPLDLGAFSMY